MLGGGGTAVRLGGGGTDGSPDDVIGGGSVSSGGSDGNPDDVIGGGSVCSSGSDMAEDRQTSIFSYICTMLFVFSFSLFDDYLTITNWYRHPITGQVNS